MQPSKLIWMDGDMVPWASAQVHVMTHALHYGSSVFEGIRCYKTPHGPCIFRLRAHIQRLLDSAKLYRFPVNHSLAQIEQGCRDAIGMNELESAYIRPLLFMGEGSIGVVPAANHQSRLAIIAVSFGRYLSEEGMTQGIDACVSSWRRTTGASIPVLAKAGGHYLNAQLIGGEARRHGYVEGISVTDRGTVSEGSAENLFVVRDGKIYTPPLTSAILNGITRDSVITLAQDLGFPVIETEIPRELLYIGDEVFMTGTAAEVTPVRSVDRIPIGNGSRGPITKAVQDAFFGLFDGTTKDKWSWLDPVFSTPQIQSGRVMARS
jgi:branched-chain amino acid aminotransferase